MRRIQRDMCHEELIKSLTSGDTPVFKEIWRVLLFAAALGIKDSKRIPIEKTDSGKAIPDTYFNSPGWKGFLYLIGLADTGDSACLHGAEEAQDYLVTAFEEYANNGLHILQGRLASSAFPLDDLISLLIETAQPTAPTPDVKDLI
ncbi:DNA phosphorothioation-associated protein 4 [Alcanivorax sp. 1008]|uniref:DNA phosphorothioation-associated protein 4 n=1 Tax=Alcanivorax sp. 1008 TaxID=2816853 RepID=UPI001E0AA6AF|nr:DNA phosphorothioation-associated protein 4 [Alcanivorax sp. 1008]MCC1498184.1 DNA phosphorothioation-associated protein 4 [Alcanivorax sp. 1008]